MNFVWLSANKFGHEILKEAIKIEKIKISAIITLSEKATTIMYDGIEKSKWYEFGIKVYEIEKINDEVQLIKELSPDYIIMCGWRQIISKQILEIPKKGFIGFHPTLLPIGRGPASIINSIISGIKESGLTMYYVSEGVDDGDIIGQEHFTIDDDDYANDIDEKCMVVGKILIKKYLPLIIKDKAPRLPQDNSQATYFPKRTLDDNEIDLDNESIDEIYRKIRALSKPYNGAFIKKNGKKLIIWKAELVN